MPTDDSFAAFWAVYPRKVAKLAALKAWRRVATSDAVVEQVMAGLRARLPEWEKMSVNAARCFIPHPATFLNGRRWEDEASGAQKTGAARVIACEKCGDTGVIPWKKIDGYGMRFIPCSCPRGQLPGLMTGPIHAEDAL